jgi:hypothetical protein
MAPNETHRRLKQRGGGLNARQGAKAENKPQCVGVKRLELYILFGKKLKQTLCHRFSLFPSVFALGPC